MVTITPVDEKNKDVFSIESLLGPKLLKEVKGSPVSTANDALKSNKSGIVALYFSASWCPPCQRFTPVLIEFYNAAKKAKSGFEIIFVSSDRSSDEFEKYYGKMPWLSIPEGEGSTQIKSKLSDAIGVAGIPALAIIDTKTGEFIAGGEAREDVLEAGGDHEKVAAIIAKWKNAERHPLEEAPQRMDTGAAGSQNPLIRLISFVAKNPMIMIGFLYLYRWVQRRMADGGTISSPEEVEAPVVEEESEF